MARYRSSLMSDREWDDYLDARDRHLNPDDAWERDQKVCPWCGNEPKAVAEDRCVSCLMEQAEKEAEKAPAIHPMFAEIFRAHFKEPGIPPSPTPAPRSEPPVAGEPDTRSINEILIDIQKLIDRVKETK